MGLQGFTKSGIFHSGMGEIGLSGRDREGDNKLQNLFINLCQIYLGLIKDSYSAMENGEFL